MEADPRLDEAGLREAHATLTRILGAIEEYVYTGEFVSEDGYSVIFAGPCREQFLGLSIEEARTAVWRHYVHPEDVELFDRVHGAARRTGRLDVDYRLIGADGVLRWVRDRGRVRHEDGRVFLDGSILDVTEVHTVQEQLVAARAEADRLAHVDHLTGVENRRSLPRLLRRDDERCAGLLSIDIDHFKQVNDLWGHAAGDAVLVAVADRLRECVRSDDAVLRMGGEEFLVILRDVPGAVALEQVADDVRHRVEAQPVAAGAALLPVTISVGAALVPAGADDFDELLRQADGALYEAKSGGRNRISVASAERRDGMPRALIPADSEALRVARAMATAAGAVEGVCAEHLAAVADLAAATAQALGRPAHDVERCRLAGLVHDVGKLRVPAAVLNKPGPLDEGEWRVMRGHAAAGEAIVRAVPELRALARVVRHHHERFDGRGYPDGLAGGAIPFEARVIAAVDTWSAMRSDRAYRTALDEPVALAELRRAAGGQLDPAVVGALLEVVGAAATSVAA